MIEPINQNKESDRDRISAVHSETIVRALNPGIWEWYVQTGELRLNDRWAEIIGYTLDELRPISIKTWETYSHPDDLNRSGELLSVHFEKHTDFYEMEARMRHKNGSWIWVLDRGKVIEWDDQGRPVLMVGSHIDITDHKRMEEIRTEEQYVNLIEKAPFPVLLVDLTTRRTITANLRARSQFGIDESTSPFTEDFYVNREDRKIFHETLQKEGSIFDFEVQLYDLKHNKIWALISASLITYKSSLAMLISINDITARKTVELTLAKERDHLKLITTMMGDVIWVYNSSTDRYVYVSPSVEQLRGYTAEEMMNQSIKDVITPDSLTVLLADRNERIKQFMADPDKSFVFYHEVEQICKDGTTVWVEMSSRYRLTEYGQLEVVGSSRNIDERKRNEARIEYLNEHDSVTGFKNRASFRKFEITQNHLKETRPISLLFIDIDHFGVINDKLGHRLGDLVIEFIGHGIEKRIEHRGLLYHFDGDEFVIVLFTVDQVEVERLCSQINRYIAEPFKLENQMVSISASIGYDVGKSGQMMDSLLVNASTALFVAKMTRNCAKAYTENLAKAQTRELQIESDLANAVERGQLELYFQPIYDNKTGQIYECEALLRWNHPEFGMVSPVEFIPIAERTRLIIPITDWVIKRALQVMSQWDVIGVKPLVVSINVSFITLANRGEELCNFIREELLVSGVSAHRLKLEVTESSLVQDAAEIIKVFIRLKELGLRLALDDFGTGYSSFAYLKALPLDIVKIDRFLVRTLEWDQKSRMIIESMITILHALGLEVVIEGVETLPQFELLRSMNADKIQGYLFSRPLNIEAFKAYYRQAMETKNLPVRSTNENWPEIRMHWHHEWDSGEPTIDQQHQDLMRKAADLERLSLLDQPNPEMIKLTLNNLLEGINTHFRDEEAILQKVHFDGLDEHRREHQSLLKRATEFVELYDEGEIDLYSFIPFLVRDVVWDHLLKEDIKFFHLFGTMDKERQWRQIDTVSTTEEQRSRMQLRENAGLQALLATISSRLINVDSTDADRKINETLALCGEFFDVDRVYIFKYDWQAKTISNTYEWCHEGIEPQIDQLQDGPMELYEDWVNAHLQGETILVERVTDLDPESGLRQTLEPQGIISLVTVPLMGDNICHGFVGFDSVRKQHTYSDLERAMLRELSNILLVTIKRKAQDEQLIREKSFYELTVSSLDEGIILVDQFRRITLLNPVAERLIGRTLNELRGLDIRDELKLYNVETMELFSFNESTMNTPGYSQSLPPFAGFIDASGKMVHVGGRSSLLMTPQNETVLLINFRDVTSEYEAKQQIDAFLNINLDPMCVADLDGHFIKVNHRFSEVLGYSTEELNGKPFLEWVHPEDVDKTLEIMQQLNTTRHLDGFVNRYRTRDGRIVSLEWSIEVGYDKFLYAAARDVTHRVKKQSESEYQAFHDVLTDVYNRRYLEEVFKNLSMDRRSHPITVLLADVDGLKRTNDTLGHATGDQLIVAAAQRLSSRCRPSDVIGRWGGDEFIVILPKTSAEDGQRIVDRILETSSLEMPDTSFVLSIGAATKETVEDLFPDVVRLADQRMYAMKAQHRHD